MKLNKQDQDGEDIPIISSDNLNNKSMKKHFQNEMTLKKTTFLLIICIVILVFINLSLIIGIIYYKLTQTIEELEEKIEIMESNIINLKENSMKKKTSIAVIHESLYGNGIGRIITLLTELLAKTGKYDVYLINEKTTIHDLPYYKGVKRIIQKKDKKNIEEFDKINNIDIYILNNDLSNFIDIYKSLGKKIIGIFHGVFLSCIFTNHTIIYREWRHFSQYDSFIQIIPDDYWIYKKFKFNNVVYIPNLYTFDQELTSSSLLNNKNVLIVGRIDDVIKGAEFGIRAMSEVVKVIPDAQLYIVSPYHSPNIKNLIKILDFEDNVHFISFTYNISEYYLNSSVLIVPSVSESFPMVMNEGKAHGLPIVAFNIDYSPSFQNGVITVDMFDYKAMANEVIKLLNDYNYRKKKGREAKISLDMHKNNEAIATWEELFSSLMNGTEEYKKFQQKIEKKYYNEEIAKERIERHYRYAQEYNKIFRCHSFEQFTNINYLMNIKECKIEESNITKS